MWNEDEAGPYKTMPYPGQSWQPMGQPVKQEHEDVRLGTAKLLTLFHPSTGEVRVKGVRRVTNEVLHGWMKEQLEDVLAALPAAPEQSDEERVAMWTRWQTDLPYPITGRDLPPLRLLLIMDNLVGHTSYTFVRWLLQHGVLPLYTPIGASWLNMAESVQRILVRRALEGQHPRNCQTIIDNLEGAARFWNRCPTPFEWGGRRKARRERARMRRLGGSGAVKKREWCPP